MKRHGCSRDNAGNGSFCESDTKSNSTKDKEYSWHFLVLQQAVLGILIAFLVYLAIIPSPIDPLPFRTNFSIPRFEGILEPNNKLQNIEKLFEGQISGPDSITEDRQGNLYTSLVDGRIVKLTKQGQVVEIARTGKNLSVCGTYDTEPDCGRPLGLRMDNEKENLIVCDAYYGLLKVNLDTKSIQTLIQPGESIDGLPLNFPNDIVVSRYNVIYFTDSSWKWKRRNSRYAVLEATPRGRLISYNMMTRVKRVLLKDLFIPNGVELSDDEQSLLVAETTTSRISRYYIKGPKQGTHEVFAENLPGYPANIRSNKDGGLWVGLIAIRKWPFAFLDSVGPYPMIRSLLTKLLSQDSMTALIPRYGMLLKLSNNGEILESFHDPTGKTVGEVTEVYESDGMLYLGSHKHNFIGKLKL